MQKQDLQTYDIEKIKFLKRVPFFSDMNTSLLENVAKIATERDYKKNEVIFYEGDKGATLFIIKEGKAKIVKLSEDGREKILTIIRPGDYFGEMAIIEQEPRSATVIAQEDLKVLIIYQYDFQQILSSNLKIMLNIIKTLCKRLRHANQQIEDLVFKNVRTRIISAICSLSEKHGKKVKDGIEIDLKLTHQDIGSIVAASRETVTKILGELEDKKLIKAYSKKIFVLNIDELKRKSGIEELDE